MERRRGSWQRPRTEHRSPSPDGSAVPASAHRRPENRRENMSSPAPMTEPPRDLRTGSHLVGAALRQEMDRDAAVVVFGEDVAKLGGVLGATRGLARRFGDRRVFDTPVSETAFVGMAVGAAQAGLRPVVELMFVDFLGVCFDQILNQIAKNQFISGGRVRMPLVLRAAAGCLRSAPPPSQGLSAG